MREYNLKLGELLLNANKINGEQLNKALKEQDKSKNRIGEILVQKGFVTNQDIIEVLEFQLGIPHIDLEKFPIKPEIVLEIPEYIAKRYELIAIDIRGNYLVVAMSDPLNIFAFEDLKIYTKYEIQPVISSKEIIQKSIERYYREDSTAKMIKEFTDSYETNDIIKAKEDELSGIATAPVVKLVNSIIEQAVDMRASDIHIEPYSKEIRIRFRIDGDLQEIMQLSRETHSAIVTRIKIMGKMNIAERRLPQDGRVEMKIDGREIDIRISTIATVYGEKIVLRLLDRSNFLFSKGELGLTKDNLKLFDKILGQPYGMILITGPTGSGKTTTLYAILKELNEKDRNIITIEDPVEYKIEGINQVQINPKAGLTFASGLRSMLRQDPDIIMVGEIRDSETAEIAVRAAITGHLVLSTLHTNDSASTIIRLVDMGVEPYLVSSALTGIVSQRLVKELCPRCKVPYEACNSEEKLLGIDPESDYILYKAKGCNRCNNGFIGRRAVHELMVVNEAIREQIGKRVSLDELRALAEREGMVKLIKGSVNLALQGITTMEEVIKAGYTLG